MITFDYLKISYMIPGFTPPTDNLYKFIALFGLAIFLFSLFKSGELFLESKETKNNIEDLRSELHHYMRSVRHHDHNPDDTTSFTLNAFRVKALSSDLHEISSFVESSTLKDSAKFEMDVKIRKLFIESSSLRIRMLEYYFIFFLGLILMSIGFSLWYFKDQRIKDRRLKEGNPISEAQTH